MVTCKIMGFGVSAHNI